MKLACISFTPQGCELEKQLITRLTQAGYQADGYALARLAEPFSFQTVKDLSSFCEIGFCEYDGLIFISACGIAVRGIAPFLKNKRIDPAVVVLDEQGCYVISLLSGHVGEANRLASETAQMIGAVPIITTATDINHCFAADCWAKKEELVCWNPEMVKLVSSSVLSGRPVGFDCDFPILGHLPNGLIFSQRGPIGISVSVFQKELFDQTLFLIPRQVVLGIGCRRGIKKEQIEQAVEATMRCYHLFFESVKQVCSIDRKKEEPGLTEFCRENRLPFVCYSAEELIKARGEFSASDFVTSVTGVENVCERAAVFGSRQGKLLVGKQTYHGVTVAVAVEERTFSFASGEIG